MKLKTFVKKVAVKTAKVTASAFLLGSLGFGTAKAMAPDTLKTQSQKPQVQKVVPYPYYGGGMSANFTINERLGDFAYVSQNVAEGSSPSTLFWINKGMGGIRFTAITDGSNSSLAVMKEVLPNTTIGLRYSKDKMPEYALSYIPFHDDFAFSQIGFQYNPMGDIYSLASDTRFSLNKQSDLTLALGVDVSKENSPQLNYGLQLSYENIRLSTNYDGKRFLIAPQIYLGVYLPDMGLSITRDGLISGWIGVTCLL